MNKDYYLLGQAYNKDPLMTKSIDIITPRLGMTKDEFKDRLSYFRYNKGKDQGRWIQNQYQSNYMVRALITLVK